MLQVEAVDPSTLELLKKLMRIKKFSGLRLVGGTALVLRSLNYFKDADQDIMPTMISNVNWYQVKNKIKKEVQSYLNQ